MQPERIINELRTLINGIIRDTEIARLDSLMQYYAETPDFLAVSADGMIRHYADFKKICSDYYGSIREQKLITNHEIYHVLNETLVTLCWSGNIDAFFKNGDLMKLRNYAVSFLFQKIGGVWKVIHCHESSLPPQIISKS